MIRGAKVVIVGGGPAGTSTALSLLGERPDLAGDVLLLEKARYPRDKPCAGALGARGDALLRAMGVVIDVPSVVVDGISYRSAWGDAVALPGAVGRVVRRREFDQALARHAVDRGAVVCDGVTVIDVDADDPERGVVVRTSAGDVVTSVVVGCDGVGSVVRRTLGVGRARWQAQAIEVDTEPLASELDRRDLHFDASDPGLAGYAWDFPTVVDGRRLVSRGVYQIRGAGDARAPDVGRILASRLRALGFDPDRYGTRRFAERGFEGEAALAGDGRMLVGEAAGIDALTGEGIAQAIEYGGLAGLFLASRLPPAGTLDTSGWTGFLRRTRLARDLRLRGRFVPLFCGRHREALERFFVESPAALAVGGRHFAAQAHDWIDLGEVAARGLAHLASAWIARALAGG